jgi:hypothetical protein
MPDRRGAIAAELENVLKNLRNCDRICHYGVLS